MYWAFYHLRYFTFTLDQCTTVLMCNTECALVRLIEFAIKTYCSHFFIDERSAGLERGHIVSV